MIYGYCRISTDKQNIEKMSTAIPPALDGGLRLTKA